MNKRLIFCVETTKKADTDYQYIKGTINHFYNVPSNMAIPPVYMGSKSRYNSKAVMEEIKKQRRYSKDLAVIYCIDTDDYDVSAQDQTLLKQIEEFCYSNHFELVFFCKDIEDVYWGRQLPDTEKVAAVRKFNSSHAIELIDASQLERQIYQTHCSNILLVLDKYLERKAQN